jgi:hypothetical protein
MKGLFHFFYDVVEKVQKEAPTENHKILDPSAKDIANSKANEKAKANEKSC